MGKFEDSSPVSRLAIRGSGCLEWNQLKKRSKKSTTICEIHRARGDIFGRMNELNGAKKSIKFRVNFGNIKELTFFRTGPFPNDYTRETFVFAPSQLACKLFPDVKWIILQE